MTFSALFLGAVVAHVVADFFLQTKRMAMEKTDLTRPPGWWHGAWHLAALLFVFPPPVALAVALSHVLLDTRKPLAWYRRVLGQDTEGGPGFVCFAFAQDQASHLLVLALAALAVAR